MSAGVAPEPALAHLRGAPAGRRLLVVVHRLSLGGVSALYGAVAGAATARGWAVVIMGARAEGGERIDWGEAHLLAVDEWDAGALPALEALADEATLTVLAVTQETTALAPLVAASGRAVLTIHGPPAVMREWLGPARLAVLRAVAGAHPEVGLLVPGRPYVEPQRADIGGARGSWGWMPHVTGRAAAALSRPGGAPPTGEVLCPQRLTPDKRFVVRAAAGVAAAAGARLSVVGQGGDVPWIEEHLASVSGLEYRVVQDPDIAAWIARAEVVVGVGLVALEALAAGACVVGACYHGDGTPWEPATPATWAMLHAQNFAGIDARPLSGEQVWERLGAITAADRSALADLVRRDAAPAAALDALLAAAGPAPGRPPSALAGAVTRAALDGEAELGRLAAYIPEVTAARDWHRARAERLEALREARAPQGDGAAG